MDTDNLDRAKQDNVIADQYRIGSYFYDVIVHFFQLWIGGASKWRRSFVQLVCPHDGERIVELCGGTGSVSLKISKAVTGTMWASDLSSGQIRVAALTSRLLRRNIELSVQDASRTTYPSAFFDKVVISRALDEIERERRLAIYREVRRILDADGSFYVTEPDLPESGWGEACFEFMSGPWNREHATAYELIRGGLRRELERAGFHLERSMTSNFGLFRHGQYSLRTPA